MTARRTLPALPLVAVLLLGACTTAAPPSAPPTVPVPPPPLGLDRILGKGVAAVTALLGPASLDRPEGTARQLVFIRPPCVLDVFLYPDARGVAAVRTAAARRPDGSRLDAGVCLALIAPGGG